MFGFRNCNFGIGSYPLFSLTLLAFVFAGCSESQAIEKWGFVDKSGRTIVEPKYKRVDSFSNGKAYLYEFDPSNPFNQSPRKIEIDKTGAQLTAESIKASSHYEEPRVPGKLSVKRFASGEYGYVDYQGTTVIPGKFSYCHPFNNKLAIVEIKRDGPYELIDEKGVTRARFIDSPPVDRIDWLDREKGLLFSRRTKGDSFAKGSYEPNWITTVFNTKGKKLFTLPGRLRTYSDGFGILEVKGGREGVVNALGETVIPANYEKLELFSGGLAAAKDSHGWKYLNKKGKTMIALDSSYVSAGSFHEGLAVVSYLPPHMVQLFYSSQKNDGSPNPYADQISWTCIDPTGKSVPAFEKLNAIKFNAFNEGLAAFAAKSVDNQTRWGFVRPDGSLMTPPTFKHACDFQHGLAAFSIEDGTSEKFNAEHWKQVAQSNQTYWGREKMLEQFLKERNVFDLTKQEIEKFLGNGKDCPVASYAVFSASMESLPGFLGRNNSATATTYTLTKAFCSHGARWAEFEYDDNQHLLRYRLMSTDAPESWVVPEAKSSSGAASECTTKDILIKH